MGNFWRSFPGALMIVLLLAMITAVGAVTIQVNRATHPPRESGLAADLSAVPMRVEEIHFRSSDGIDIAGWLLRGRPELPPIVLCHDLGESKNSVVNLAIALQKAGFTLLAFDFRAHGQSGGAFSTLGVLEKRDVLGAVDHLASVKGIDSRRVGIYGVGVGAHAAVLAAVDRPALRVLVLDGLYPDAVYPLVRKSYAGWGFGIRYLGALPRLVFRFLTQVGAGSERAADLLPRLAGRDLLLVAPAGDGALANEMQRMFESIPEQRETDANLITLPATHTSHLYGEEAERYQTRISQFFEDRLDRR